MKNSNISEGIATGIKNWALRTGFGGRGRQVGAQLMKQQQITDKGYQMALKQFYLDGFKRALGVTIDPASTENACGGMTSTPPAGSTTATSDTDDTNPTSSVGAGADGLDSGGMDGSASTATPTTPSAPSTSTTPTTQQRVPFRQKLASRNAAYYSGVKESISSIRSIDESIKCDLMKQVIYLCLANTKSDKLAESVRKLLNTKKINESSVRTLNLGNFIAESFDIFHINRLLKEVDLTWKDVGLTVIEHSDRKYRVVGSDYATFFAKYNLLEAANGKSSICNWFLATTKSLLAREKLPQMNAEYTKIICQYATNLQNTYQNTRKIDDKQVDGIVATILDWRYSNTAMSAGRQNQSAATPMTDLDVDNDNKTEPAEVKSFKQQFMNALNRVPLDGSDNNAALSKVMAVYLGVLLKQDPDLFKKIETVMKKTTPTAT